MIELSISVELQTSYTTGRYVFAIVLHRGGKIGGYTSVLKSFDNKIDAQAYAEKIEKLLSRQVETLLELLVEI